MNKEKVTDFKTQINVDDIKKAIHDLDLIYRPYALMINPVDKERFEQAMKDTEFEGKVILQEHIFVEAGKAYLIRREDLEKWQRPWAKIAELEGKE